MFSIAKLYVSEIREVHRMKLFAQYEAEFYGQRNTTKIAACEQFILRSLYDSQSRWKRIFNQTCFVSLSLYTKYTYSVRWVAVRGENSSNFRKILFVSIFKLSSFFKFLIIRPILNRGASGAGSQLSNQDGFSWISSPRQTCGRLVTVNFSMIMWAYAWSLLLLYTLVLRTN